MFDKALRFEHNYPPKWSGPLHPSEFSHIISAEYIAKYKDKEIEYNTPPNKRVYCQYDVPRAKVYDNGTMEFETERCCAFIGRRRKFIKDDTLVFGRCKGLNCANVTCMVCDYYRNDSAENMLQHTCLGKSLANEKRAQAFSGLKRGKDWQQCPSRQCERRIELSMACNHISCQCGMGFCFICGKKADGESDHWRKGGCPRYNQPGDANVEYDDYDEDEDDRISSTDEHDEGESEVDVLENIRDLFETDENSLDSPDPPHPVRDDVEQTLAAAVLASRWRVPIRIAWDDALTRVPMLADDQLFEEGSAVDQLVGETSTVDRLVGETSTVDQLVGENPVVDHLVEESPVVDQLADRRDAEVEEEPGMRELIAIAPNDAEAIASAYWEDDMSDDGHYGFLCPSPPGSPVVIVTTEEADIDSALWMMAVE